MIEIEVVVHEHFITLAIVKLASKHEEVHAVLLQSGPAYQ
jgi:hypothetical protein